MPIHARALAFIAVITLVVATSTFTKAHAARGGKGGGGRGAAHDGSGHGRFRARRFASPGDQSNTTAGDVQGARSRMWSQEGGNGRRRQGAMNRFGRRFRENQGMQPGASAVQPPQNVTATTDRSSIIKDFGTLPNVRNYSGTRHTKQRSSPLEADRTESVTKDETIVIGNGRRPGSKSERTESVGMNESINIGGSRRPGSSSGAGASGHPSVPKVQNTGTKSSKTSPSKIMEEEGMYYY